MNSQVFFIVGSVILAIVVIAIIVVFIILLTGNKKVTAQEWLSFGTDNEEEAKELKRVQEESLQRELEVGFDTSKYAKNKPPQALGTFSKQGSEITPDSFSTPTVW